MIARGRWRRSARVRRPAHRDRLGEIGRQDRAPEVPRHPVVARAGRDAHAQLLEHAHQLAVGTAPARRRTGRDQQHVDGLAVLHRPRCYSSALHNARSIGDRADAAPPGLPARRARVARGPGRPLDAYEVLVVDDGPSRGDARGRRAGRAAHRRADRLRGARGRARV